MRNTKYALKNKQKTKPTSGLELAKQCDLHINASQPSTPTTCLLTNTDVQVKYSLHLHFALDIVPRFGNVTNINSCFSLNWAYILVFLLNTCLAHITVINGRQKSDVRTDKYKKITNDWNYDIMHAYIITNFGAQKM